MNDTRPPHTTAWRFCASCLATLLYWALWLVLGIALGWQAYVALAREVSVPDFILRRIESALAAENFSVRFGHATLDPSGGILLEQVQLRSNSFEDPLLTSQYIYLHKSIWSILAGQPMPDVVRLAGASIHLPAMFSPSGTAEQLLRDVNADFRFSGELWSVERLTGQMGNLPLSITGKAARPRTTRGIPLTAAEITSRYLQYARQAVLALPKLQTTDQPRLEIACTPREEGGMNLELSFFAESARLPGDQPVELGPLSLSGQWRWDGLKSYPLQLQLTTQSVTSELASARHIQTSLTLEPGTGPALFGPIHGQLAAASLQAVGEKIGAPMLTGSYWPDPARFEFATAFESHGQVLALNGSVDLGQKSAVADFSGRIPPALVTGMLTRYRPKLEPYFRFGDPVVVDAHAKVDGNWQFGGIWSHVQVGRMDSRGVLITSARGRVDIDAGLNFFAHEAFVVAGENRAGGSYWMNFHSMDYRFLLSGWLRPVEISGWFGGDGSTWWPDFWSNFAFPSAPPHGDADVQGRWGKHEGWHMTYFGLVDTGPVEVLHAGFERTHLRIFLRPQFTHVMDLSASRAGGAQQAAGWFKRTASPDSPTASETIFDLTGNLDPATLKKLGGETAESLLAPFALNHPPQMHLWGRTGKSDNQPQSDLQFTGQIAGPLTYSHFPLDEVAVRGRLKGDLLNLDQIELRTAGGQGHGQATLEGPSQNRLLHFDFKIKEADLARSIRAVEAFEAGRTGVKGESMTDSKFIKRASGGKLDLAITAQGNPENPTRLKGEGTLQLTGAELGEINLFGLLSQVLRFSSLKLDAARSSFQLADGKVYFPDVRITGKSALIDAKGSYLIDNKTVDFIARLKPYEEVSNPLTAVVSLFMNPLTRMFELQLTGPLANPKWTVNFGSSAPTPAEPETKPETPPPATAPIPVPEP